MVYAFVRYFLEIIAEESSCPEGFEHAVQRMAAFFYADDYMLESTLTEWLQCAFEILTVISKRNSDATYM